MVYGLFALSFSAYDMMGQRGIWVFNEDMREEKRKKWPKQRRISVL